MSKRTQIQAIHKLLLEFYMDGYELGSWEYVDTPLAIQIQNYFISDRNPFNSIEWCQIDEDAYEFWQNYEVEVHNNGSCTLHAK